jgi:outer membrane protein OmpA-like peptidoglycan-associated protein
MLQYPDTLIRVEGHTDSTGTEEYNMDLSARRADSVKNLIVQKGIAPVRLETMAFGESSPVATNDTEAGRQMNRRVEIKIAPKNYG